MRLLNEKEGMMREIIAKRLRSLRSLYIDIPALRPGTVGAYALAVLSVGIATVLRLAVDPYVEGVQFVTFWPAVVGTTLISGIGAGFLCAMLSTAAVDFFVLEPRWSFNVEDPVNLANLLLFGPLAFSSVILLARMRFAIELKQEQAIKDRLQLALDAAQLGWWQYDPLTHLVLSDARCQEILGATKNEAPIEELLNPVHPDDADRLWAAINAALNPDDPKRSAAEFRLQRRNGEVIWVETLGLASFEGARHERRAVSMVGTAQDVTERKEREERERLLMREVSHRAGNMLSVVDAIAHQTVTRNPQGFIERFSERIQALAANQNLLIRGEWKGVEIEDLARAQLAPFADLLGSRIAMRGPKLRLNAASAQAIGLALHELTTNAGKYGALSKDTGGLDVGWGTDGETFTMSWTERDGPPVSAPQRRGFGTVVMQEMAERSVNGKVDLEYAPSGVSWRLTCPAVDALEPTNSREYETRISSFPTPHWYNHPSLWPRP
jgi:PAS domain S-box-containing protein